MSEIAITDGAPAAADAARAGRDAGQQPVNWLTAAELDSWLSVVRLMTWLP
jgi:hypothetical protein